MLRKIHYMYHIDAKYTQRMQNAVESSRTPSIHSQRIEKRKLWASFSQIWPYFRSSSTLLFHFARHTHHIQKRIGETSKKGKIIKVCRLSKWSMVEAMGRLMRLLFFGGMHMKFTNFNWFFFLLSTEPSAIMTYHLAGITRTHYNEKASKSAPSHIIEWKKTNEL